MMPSSNEQSEASVEEPITTSAPQTPGSQVEEPEIPSSPEITSFCDIADLNSHYKNQNLKFNCGKKSCTGQFPIIYII